MAQDYKNFVDPKLIEFLEKSNELIIANGKSIDDVLLPAIKKLEDAQSKLGKETKENAEKRKKLTAEEKEAARIAKQLETTEAKLTSLQKGQQDALIKTKVALQQTTAAEKEKIKTSKAHESSLVRMRQRLKELTTAYDNTGKRTKAAAQEINKLSTQIEKAEKATNRHGRGVGGYGKQIKGLALQFAGALGLTSAIFMFVNVLKGAFGTIRNFSKENAVLAGVLGKTRDEITELTDQAVQLGSVYPITASEVVKLQVSFARLGFTMLEIQDLTEATIQGSIALNAELDATATLVGAVVKAYSDLGTSDAGKIIDQLTIATQRSSLSFSGLETALPKVAAAASALNVPLSKTLSLLSIAQDATLDASISGTSLRNIFLEISNEGITLEEALDKINNSSNRLTASYELFGKRGAIVGLALADNKDKAIELAAEYENVGNVAETVAKEQMATLDGAIKGLGSSWEKFILQAKGSEGALSVMTNFFSNLIDGVTEASAAIGPASGIFFATLFGLDDKVREESIAKVKEFNKTTTEELKKALLAQQQLRQDARKAGDKLAERSATNTVTRLFNIIEKREKVENEARIRDELALKRAELEKLALEREGAEKIAKERKKAEEKANKEIETERDRHYDQLRKSNKKFVEDSKKDQRSRVNEEIIAQNELIDSQDQLETDKLAKRNKQNIENTKQGLKNLEEEELAKQEIKTAIEDAAFEAAGMLSEAFTGRKIANIQKEFDVLEMQKEAELAKENLTAEEKQKIEEKYAKKAAALKTKQAKAEKEGAIFTTLINTAAAVVKALPNVPLSIIAGTLGAIQLGIIAAQPIPQFAKGTNYSPGGVAELAEQGREMVVNPDGKIWMAENRGLYDLQQGSKVITHTETKQKELNDRNIVKGLVRVEKAIRNQSGQRNESAFSARQRGVKEGYLGIKHRLN